MGGGKGSQTIGYKYLVGMQLEICHGPIDKITGLQIDERQAWVLGQQPSMVTRVFGDLLKIIMGYHPPIGSQYNGVGNGQIYINKDQLFGGKDREGGVGGRIDVCLGGPDQLQNDYLVGKCSPLVPAFRGVTGLVFRQFYMGNNPYLKPWKIRAQRIHVTGSEGDVQWYDEKAAIPSFSSSTEIETDIVFVGGQSFTAQTSGGGGVTHTFGPIVLTGGIASAPQVGDLIVALATESGAATGEHFVPTVQNGFVERGSAWSSSGGTGYLDATSVVATKFVGEDVDTSIDVFSTDTLALSESTGVIILVFRGVHPDVLDVPAVLKLNYGGYAVPSAIVLSNGVEVDPGAVSTNTNDANASITLALKSATGAQALVVAASHMQDPSADWIGGLLGHYVFGEPDSSAGHGFNWGEPIYILDAADMNPSHIIRECLTDPDWGLGYSTDDIDDTSFSSAADTLYNEGMGISLLWDKQIRIEDFVNEITKHIDAALYVSRVTGKFVLKLIRDDYDEESLLHLDESNIAKIASPSRAAFGELVNSVTVNYWNSETGKDDSLTVQDTAMIQMHGQTIPATMQYPGFTSARNAAIAGQRDLRALSIPFLSCTIYTDRTAKDLTIGECFKLSWAKWNIVDLVMRVTSIAYGDGRNNQVKITCTEDVFATPTVGVVGDAGGGDGGWEDPSQIPVISTLHMAEETPYLDLVRYQGQTNVEATLAANNEVGYLMAAAIQQGSAVNAGLWVDSGADYKNNGIVDFCAGCELSAPLGKTDTTLYFTNEVDLHLIVDGTYFQIDSEVCRVDSVDDDAGTMVIGRGALDTVPEEHAAGTIAFFLDGYNGVDKTEYVEGESLDVKLTPQSGSGQVDISLAEVDNVVMASRAFRPYPPGDLRINGLSYSDDFLEGTLSVTWTDRDRTQQTSGIIFDHTYGNIGPEVGTTYRVRTYVDAVLVDTVEPATTLTNVDPGFDGTVRIEVDSKRDGVYSWQAANHEFPYVVTGGPRVTEADEYRVTEDGVYRATED